MTRLDMWLDQVRRARLNGSIGVVFRIHDTDGIADRLVDGNALEHFTRLLRSDAADIQGGTTAEGVHLAAMAGSVDVLQRCFTGLEPTFRGLKSRE